MQTLKYYLVVLRANLWAWPLAMALLSVGLAAVLIQPGVETDHLPSWLAGWLYAGSAEAASSLAESLLAGVIALFALQLSVTMVVLVLAAAQLGSRLVHSFVEDRATRLVIGLFVAVMLYMLVLCIALGEVTQGRLPRLAITVGALLSALCPIVLVVYINRLARAIVFDNTARRVLREIRDSSRRLQEHRSTRMPDHATVPDSGLAARVIAAPLHGARLARHVDGYIQSIDYASLMKAAEDRHAVLHVLVRPGHWINASTPCVEVAPAQAADGLRRIVRRAIIVGAERTPTQDLEFGLQRLVEISLRALSPAVNDLFTALAAIDNLSAAVARIFSRPLLPPVLCGPDGRVCLMRDVSTAEGIVHAAFDYIRRAGAHMPEVAIRLLDALGRLRTSLHSEAQRQAVLAQIDATLASARAASMVDEDADAVAARHQHAREAVAQAPLLPPLEGSR